MKIHVQRNPWEGEKYSRGREMEQSMQDTPDLSYFFMFRLKRTEWMVRKNM